MRKSSGWKGSATITRLSWGIEILERIEPRGGPDSRVNHQNDARETGKAIPFRWRRGWERGSRSGWICVAMAEAQEDRAGRVARRSESQSRSKEEPCGQRQSDESGNDFSSSITFHPLHPFSSP